MKALIVVDMQNDFMEEGALGVKGADGLVFVINSLIEAFPLVVATKDWHPREHCSFSEQGGKWPVHCVQNTKGAEFVFGLNTERIAEVFFKGTDPMIDSYSAFFDNAHQKKTELDDYLRNKGVEEIYLAGLTTDFCVLYSALDGIELGYQVHVITNACKAIDQKEQALEEMRERGVQLCTASEVL